MNGCVPSQYDWDASDFLSVVHARGEEFKSHYISFSEFRLYTVPYQPLTWCIYSNVEVL